MPTSNPSTPSDLARMAGQIEVFLLIQRDWVPEKVLVEHFGIRDRLLRADDKVGRVGLLDDFAVSCELGFKHVNLLTVQDRIRAKHRIRRHWVAEMRKERRQQRAIENARVGLRPHQVERHTGQCLLGLQEPRPSAHVGPCAAQAA